MFCMNTAPPTSQRTVLITPSYQPDLQRCSLMLETAQRHVTNMQGHYVIVDHKDLPHFAHLRSSHVHIIAKEDMLPGWIKKIPGFKKWWISAKTLPVRGWILQQVIKLAVAEHVDADAYCFADSDVAFIRHFDANTLWDGDRLRFQREERRGVMLRDKRYKNWYGVAAKYSGVTNPDDIKGAYIAQLNTMKRSAVLQMFRQMERVEGKPWMQSLLGTWDFSEFILYGAFVEYAMQGQGHFIPPKLLCHSSWYHDIDNAAQLAAFIEQVDHDQVAVHIQSNLKIDSETYRHLIK